MNTCLICPVHIIKIDHEYKKLGTGKINEQPKKVKWKNSIKQC